MAVQIQQRYVLTFMMFLAILIGLAERSVLPMAITRMVEIPNQNVSSVPTTESICAAPHWMANNTGGSTTIDQSQIGIKYDWSQEQQGAILSAFYTGYLVTHIPGGLLAQAFGGKHVLGLGIMISALLSMATPAAAERGGAAAVIAIRVLMGVFQGPMFPAATQILSVWIPVNERARATSITFAGMTIGIVVSTYFSGMIMHYYDWEMVFYAFGAVAIIWFALYVLLCHKDPASHPFISAAEKEYLLRRIGQLKRAKNQPTPWREILTSKPVWALLISFTLNDWCLYVLLTTLPKYMNDVLHFSIRDVGTYISLPWILRTLLTFAFGYAVDKAVAKQSISVTNARKLAVFIASVLPAVFIVAASYAECDHVLVVVFFVFSVGMQGTAVCGVAINPMDLSPNYAGLLMSLANGAGSLTGILAPFSVGLLTPNAYLSEWRAVFWVTFAAHIIKTVIFSVWGSGDVQPWNVSNAAKIESANVRLL